jgi:hypothetical protein
MALGSLFGSLGKIVGGASVANPAGLGIAAGAGLLKAGLGFLQQAKGKKMLKRTVDPGYKIPKGFGQNLAQAEQMARAGLGSQQYNQAQQNISRNVGTGVRALSRSANPAAGVAGLVRAQNDATLGLDVSNAAAKRQNILQAMGARREMAGQQLAQQQYQQNRYFDKVNEAQSRIGAGTQNIFGGISDIGTAGIYGSMGGSNPSVEDQASKPSPYNTQKYMSSLGMPNPATASPLSGFPFENYGGLTNQQKITQKFRPKTIGLIQK